MTIDFKKYCKTYHIIEHKYTGRLLQYGGIQVKTTTKIGIHKFSSFNIIKQKLQLQDDNFRGWTTLMKRQQSTAMQLFFNVGDSIGWQL